MIILNRIIFVGFTLAALSFLAAVMGFDRVISIYIFILGFYALATGIVLKTINMNYADRPEFNGMKFCAIGFLIMSLNFLVKYANLSPSVSLVLTWVGGLLMVIGVLVYLVKRGH